MFSIIIPLYNKAPYIRKAIESVLAQTFQEFELIIVDDGSTDDSLEKLGVLSSEFGDSFEFGVLSSESNSITNRKRVRVYQQANQGVSVARNNGVKLAKYDYIAFLDADDWWEPTYLEEMKGLIEKFPEAGIYGSSYYIAKNNLQRLARIGVESTFKNGYINYFKVYSNTGEMPLWTGATIVKKDVLILEDGFKPQLKLGEDFDLWLRIALKYPVAFLNKPLAYYNQDVELANRAIGEKLYEPEQHMLFSDYSELNENPDFRYLYEVLAVYGLLPYYLSGKNKKEVDGILNTILWGKHSFKYRLYYRFLPRVVVKFYFEIIKLGSLIKAKVKSKE